MIACDYDNDMGVKDCRAKSGKLLAALLLFLSFTVVLGKGEEARRAVLFPVKDGTIYSDRDASGAYLNHGDGGGSKIYAGNNARGFTRRGLLAFDLVKAIPEGAEIIEAELSLNLSGGNEGLDKLSLHRLTGDWGESEGELFGEEKPGNGSGDRGETAGKTGGGGGMKAKAGDATWTHRFFDRAEWGIPGGDFVENVSAARAVREPGRYGWSGKALLEDVRFWLRFPERNYGWILRGKETRPETAKVFDGRLCPDPEKRPALKITYRIKDKP